MKPKNHKNSSKFSKSSKMSGHSSITCFCSLHLNMGWIIFTSIHHLISENNSYSDPFICCPCSVKENIPCFSPPVQLFYEKLRVQLLQSNLKPMKTSCFLAGLNSWGLSLVYLMLEVYWYIWICQILKVF